MADYWRLTRNQYTRGIYDALKTLGITATKMYEYQIELKQISAMHPSNTPPGITIDLISTSEAYSLNMDIDFSLPVDVLDGEWVVIALINGHPIGRTLVADVPKQYIDPLERPLAVSGAYLRKVFVIPEQRGHGVASAILRAAVGLARDELAVDTATALIAADNKPSQILFENCGFKRRGVHEYIRVGPLSKYQYRDS